MLFSPNKNIKIVLAGGGSGGHVFPIISVCEALNKYIPEFERQGLSVELIYFGANDFTLDYVKNKNISIKVISCGKGIRDFWKTIIGFFQAFWNLFIVMPDAIFGKGGFATVPTLSIGVLFRIPIFIHESDSIPGKVNQFFGRFAKGIFISFEKSADYFAQKDKLILSGNPIRDFLNIPDSELEKIDKNQTKKLLALQTKKPVLLVLGGSQGAQTLNDLILDGLSQFLEYFEVIHQTGQNNIEQVKREVDVIFREYNINQNLKPFYHPVGFLQESQVPSINSLKDCLIASDIVVARSGSGSIFEIAAFGKPSVLIPLPWASADHQTVNAFAYASSQSSLRAIVLEQENLKPNLLCNTLKNLVSDKQKLKEMSQNALKFAKKDASLSIARVILQYIIDAYQ